MQSKVNLQLLYSCASPAPLEGQLPWHITIIGLTCNSIFHSLKVSPSPFPAPRTPKLRDYSALRLWLGLAADVKAVYLLRNARWPRCRASVHTEHLRWRSLFLLPSLTLASSSLSDPKLCLCFLWTNFKIFRLFHWTVIKFPSFPAEILAPTGRHSALAWL